jgi:hypothetical protein
MATRACPGRGAMPRRVQRDVGGEVIFMQKCALPSIIISVVILYRNEQRCAAKAAPPTSWRSRGGAGGREGVEARRLGVSGRSLVLQLRPEHREPPPGLVGRAARSRPAVADWGDNTQSALGAGAVGK